MRCQLLPVPNSGIQSCKLVAVHTASSAQQIQACSDHAVSIFGASVQQQTSRPNISQNMQLTPAQYAVHATQAAVHTNNTGTAVNNLGWSFSYVLDLTAL
jgi:hypothetical protein